VIVSIRITAPGAVASSPQDGLQQPAANAGFAHVLTIIAVRTSDDADRFLYYPTETDIAAATHPGMTANGHPVQAQLMVFQSHPLPP